MSDVLAHPLKPDILEWIEAGEWSALREFMALQPAPDIVELLDAVGDTDRILIFRLLPRRLADEVFALLDPPHQNALIGHMAQDEAREAITRMSPDDRTALLEELPARVTRRLLELLPDRQRRDALALLNYPEDSVGRLMTTAYVRIREDWTCNQVMEHIRRWGSDSETLSMLYVTDERGRLVDDIRLRQVLLADPATKVRELMDGQFAALVAQQDRADAVPAFRKYDLYAMPVVDSEGMLLGIVTHDDVLDVAEEEATEDFHRMGTVQPLETPFSEASVSLLVRRRVGWLLGLVAVNIVTGAAISAYEGLIASSVALVLFLPLLIGSGGNAGAQSATLVVRALATGDVTSIDWWRLLRREVLLGAMLGGAMAAAVFFMGFWKGGWGIASVVATAMVAAVLVNSLIGTVLPFLLLRCRADPAAASVPLVTSLADITGVLIYFSIARALLGG
jgi:magnesium transporter